MATAVQDQTSQHDFMPPQRPRRIGPALVAGVVGALAVVALSVAALRDDATTLRSDSTVADPVTTLGGTPTTAGTATTTPPTTPTAAAAPPTTAAAPPTTAAPERLTLDSRLRLDGLGPVSVGMTLAEASRAAGVAIRLHPGESGGLDCTYAYPANGSDETAFMIVGGRIVRIDVGIMGPDRVKTLSGIGKGSTEADVMRAYPGQIRVEPHPYMTGAHYLVYVPNDASSRRYSLIFEAVDDRVTSFRSGLAEQVSWIEGCS